MQCEKEKKKNLKTADSKLIPKVSQHREATERCNRSKGTCTFQGREKPGAYPK